MECEFRSILGCSCWVPFYLCGFPRPLARYWPLAYLFDGWLYDTILVRSVTEGQAARAQGMRPFSGYVFTGKDVTTSLMNPQDHVEHAGLDPRRGVQNVPLDSGCVIKNLQLYKQKRYLQPLFQGSYFSPKHSSIRHNQRDKNNNNLPLLVLKYKLVLI